jgi:hypothetical protein
MRKPDETARQALGYWQEVLGLQAWTISLEIGYALSELLPYLDDTPIKATVFRDDTGLYVLLTVEYDDHRAVLGAIYTPTLLDSLRSSGYTLTWAEAEGGVN